MSKLDEILDIRIAIQIAGQEDGLSVEHKVPVIGTKQQIKDLMLELIGNDEPTSIGDKWDEFDEAKANRNELKAKLRKEIEEL